MNPKGMLLCGDWAPQKRKVETSLAGLIVINIECPIFLSEPVESFRAIKAGPLIFNLSSPDSKFNVVAILSNNHLFDYGIKGFQETLRVIKANNWIAVGAGLSKKEASAPVFFEWEGKRVAVLARCETQFGVAQVNRPGVAALDSTVFEQIREVKKEADIVIASIHAAAEMLPWPSPSRQDFCRALIDAGADIVHGHHAHVPQGWEEYNGGWIFYGLGNFCVDPAKWKWHQNGLWSLTPELLYYSEKIQIGFKTSVIEDQGEKIFVRESTEIERSEHFSYLDVCNKYLSDRVLLEGLWQEASIRMYFHHYAEWLGFDSKKNWSFFRVVRRILGKLKRFVTKKAALEYEKREYLLRYHLFACVSHSEAISTALGVLGGELEDLRTPETKILVDKWMIDS